MSRYYRRKMSAKTAIGMLLGKLVGSQFASAAGKRFFRLRKTGGVLVVEYREIIESN